MKMKELTKMSRKDLEKLLGEERNNLQSLRFKINSGQLKDVREVRVTRILIARIKTLLNQPVIQEKTKETEEVKKVEK